MSKVMFYVQNSYGIGHLMMTLAVARRVAEDNEVLILYGGPDFPSPIPKGVKIINLPVLQDSSDRKNIVSPDSETEAVKSYRKTKILETFHKFRPDHVFVEHFPFGRWNYLFEIMPLLELSKKKEKKVFSLFRGTIGRDISSNMEWVCDIIRRYINRVFILTDKRLIDLSKEIKFPADIEKRLIYAGFAVSKKREEIINKRKVRKSLGLKDKSKFALIHTGGGRQANKIITQGTQFALNNDYEVLVSTGPFGRVLKNFQDNSSVRIVSFNPNLIDYLNAADLSISTGGYNTVAEILLTNVPSMVIPLKNGEQDMRARQLQDYFWVVNQDGLSQKKLHAAAKKSSKRIENDMLRGSEKIAAYISKHQGTKTPILCYHSIDNTHRDIQGISPVVFEKHLVWLRKHGYRAVSLNDIKNGTPRNSVVLTFDDAQKSLVNFAAPLLLKHGMTATFFVPTAFIGQEGFLSIADIKWLIENGFEIQSHTVMHSHLCQRYFNENTLRYNKRIEYELSQSKKFLEKHFPENKVFAIAWPHGEYNQLAIDVAEKTGYEIMLGGVRLPDNRKIQRRIVINRYISMNNFEQLLFDRNNRERKRIDFSVIIPTYNRERILKLVLESICQQDYPKNNFEVIVCDDGSSDNTKRLVRSFSDRIRMKYVYQENKGFRAARARNLGALEAKGNYLIFVDSDVVVAREFLKSYNDVFTNMPDVIALGYVAGFNKSSLMYSIEQGKRIIEGKEVPFYPELEREKKYVAMLDNLALSDSPWNVFYSTNVAMSKTLFEQIGGFDEKFCGYGFEDTELGYRLWKRGFRYYLCRKALGYHIAGSGTYRDPRRQKKITKENAEPFLRNLTYFYKKYKDRRIKAKLARWRAVVARADAKSQNTKRIALDLFYSKHPLYDEIIKDEIKAAKRENYDKITLLSESRSKRYREFARTLGLSVCVEKPRSNSRPKLEKVLRFLPKHTIEEGYIISGSQYSVSSGVVNIIITKENLYQLQSILDFLKTSQITRARLIFPEPKKGLEEEFDRIFPSIHDAAIPVDQAQRYAAKLGIKLLANNISYDYPKPSDLELDYSDVRPSFQVQVSKNPGVSVIVITCNRVNLLRKTLKALVDQDISKNDFEIIVVDDASRDDILGMIKKIPAVKAKTLNLKYLKWGRKRPFVSGKPENRAGPLRNLGSKYARGDTLVFLDSDIVVVKDFLQQHMNSLQKYDVVIGPQIREHEKEDHRKLLFHICGNDISKFPSYWTLLNSCNFSLRKQDFDDISGFDPDFVYYGEEDIELGYRLYRKGLKFHYNPNAYGIHLYHPPEHITEELRWVTHEYHATIFYKKHLDLELYELFFEHMKYKRADDRLPIHKLRLNNYCPNKCEFCRELRAISETRADYKAALSSYMGPTKKLILAGGEVSLRPDFMDMLKYASRNFELEIETTGIPYADKVFTRKVVAVVDDFIIRVFGNNAILHDKITGNKGSFDKMLKGVDNLHRAGAKLAAHFILCKENATFASEIIESIAAQGIETVHLSVALPFLSEPPTKKETQHVLDIYSAYSGLLSRFGKKLRINTQGHFSRCFAFTKEKNAAPKITAATIHGLCKECNLVYLCKANPKKFLSDYYSENKNIYRSCDIQSVHLEVTTKCNANCPQCPRNLNGAMNPLLPKAELSLKDIRKIMPADFLSKLSCVYMCGNYGDPICARDTLEIVRYFREVNPALAIGLHTNGSLRSSQWWADLGRLIGYNGYVRFAIDGLEDTNAIYRRNTDWEVIMRNVKAFIGAGGRGEWDFLVFKHNEHQISLAKSLAKKLGFVSIHFKKSDRFIDFHNIGHLKYTQVVDTKGKEIDRLYPPINFKPQKQAMLQMVNLESEYGSMESYLDSTPIYCKAKTKKEIFISAEGLVFPCCWIGHIYYLGGDSEVLRREYLKLRAADQNLCAKSHKIENILDSSLFQNIMKAWKLPSIKKGRPVMCALACGSISTFGC